MDFRVRSGPSPLKRRAQDGRCDSRCEIPYSPPPIDGSESPVCKAFRVFLLSKILDTLGYTVVAKNIHTAHCLWGFINIVYLFTTSLYTDVLLI